MSRLKVHHCNKLFENFHCPLFLVTKIKLLFFFQKVKFQYSLISMKVNTLEVAWHPDDDKNLAVMSISFHSSGVFVTCGADKMINVSN